MSVRSALAWGEACQPRHADLTRSAPRTRDLTRPRGGARHVSQICSRVGRGLSASPRGPDKVRATDARLDPSSWGGEACQSDLLSRGARLVSLATRT